jgi:hypothetical protein
MTINKQLQSNNDKKQVSFASSSSQEEEQEACCPNNNSVLYYLTSQERKALCWYSDAELLASREDARNAMHALQRVDGKIDAVNDASVCLRGIEKYADPTGKVMGQRRLIDSVLQQQKTANQVHLLATVSRYLSEPFREMAHYYGVKNSFAVRETEEEE